MNPIKLFNEARDFIKNPENDFSERTYLILSFLSELAVFFALAGDLYIRENPYEIALISSILVFVPLISFAGLKLKRLGIAIKVTVIFLVFGILPGLFMFGGGIKGGGQFWIIFAYIYVGLVLSGTWRNVMFFFITVFTFVFFLINYYYPWWVYRHSTSKHYIDSFISLVLVGVLCFIMNWAQGLLFKEENKRAKKEAERAEELTRSQNRFFSSMSHEIRTPINSILGLNELILRDEEATDNIVRDASGIQGAGKLLLSLINDVLDFSKIEAGSMDIVTVDYRVGDMLSEIINMMWLRAHDKGLKLEASVDPNVPMVLHGDEVRIKQVIINLLNNAVKYTEKGYVELRIESSEIEPNIAELIISVTDTGMGIKKEDIPYLFDAFKRVDEGKNRHIEGTGLGLSIVKQLVELMGGTVSVNSIYGEGSVFTVNIRQGISDHQSIGELNIHNKQAIKRIGYESSFIAPEARILIVDDNELNLEVERRLLAGTDMTIDTAKSGKEALKLSLRYRYDTIFMDHLMPGMDGIECLEALRSQEGGLNRTTTVIVLTANAGSENRDLYTRSGFDGYLMKPVSGSAMEEMLIRHVSRDKIVLRSVMMGEDEEIYTSDRYTEKQPVIITTSSMCDLPGHVVKKYGIPIIPFRLKTESGVFKDGVHIDASELVRYMGTGRDAASFPQDENGYMEFFSGNLSKAHHIIHISITSAMSKEYSIASEAARAFDNVSVVDSECLSSATGILVLIAYKLAQQGLQVEDILSELENAKKRIKCSFVMGTTEFMARKKLLSPGIHAIAKALNLHPALRFSDNATHIGGIWAGRVRHAYRKYISSALPPDTIPDSDIAFITYVDIPPETLKWIEEEIKKVAFFKRVIFQQASAAISSNCGPGTFGILYFLKSNKSYNLSSLIDNAAATARLREEVQESLEEPESPEELFGQEEPLGEEAPERQEERVNIEASGALDINEGIRNSGSEEAFKAVLKIFNASIAEKYEEIEGCYSSEDWDNYTIRVHALKSSSKLVGATELSKKAELLEKAGKEGDTDYIRSHHRSAMDLYLSLGMRILPLLNEDDSEDTGKEKPVADQYIIEEIYGGLLDAAENEDPDTVRAIYSEASAYVAPSGEEEKYAMVLKMAEEMDLDGIREALK